MSESRRNALARSAIEPAPPRRTEYGWELSGRAAVDRGATALRLTDCSALTKTSLRADPAGRVAEAVDVPVRMARRDGGGVLTAALAPGEWLALGPPHPAEPVSWPANLPDEGLVTVVDVTHGLTLLQLVGRASAAVLAKLCPVDLHDSVTPNGLALRSLVAGVVVGVIRDDVANQHRYWVFSERSVGRYLFDALLDAGAEFGIDVDGFSSDKF